MDIVRSEQEIARVENWAFAALDEGTHFAGMTYEQGLIDMLEWLRGDTNNAPDEAPCGPSSECDGSGLTSSQEQKNGKYRTAPSPAGRERQDHHRGRNKV